MLALFFGTVVIACVDFRMEAEGGVSEPRWRNQGWRYKTAGLTDNVGDESGAEDTRRQTGLCVSPGAQIGHLLEKNKGINNNMVCVQCGARVVETGIKMSRKVNG